MNKVIPGEWIHNTGVEPNLPDDDATIDLKFSDGYIYDNDGIGSNTDWGWDLGDGVGNISHWRFHDMSEAETVPKVIPVGEHKTITTTYQIDSSVPPKVTSGIGDVNSNAKGSGARFNSGKPDMSLILLSTLEDEARVWEYGKAKYAAWNFARGMAWSVPFACLLRHMSKWQSGEELDEESGLPHLDHAMCNLRMLKLYSKNYKEGDDRPPAHLLKESDNVSK